MAVSAWKVEAVFRRIIVGNNSTSSRYHNRRLFSSQRKYILGCGSNVVDHIYNVRVIPKAGEKGFFLSPFRALEAKLIGGVTLNHLCWAAYGGVPAGLLALQGNDEEGKFIRTNLQKTGVTTKFIRSSDKYSTAQCHVFIEESGERAIYMAPAASSLITAETARESFDDAIKTSSSIVTTEISQIPFTGVLEILKMAREAGIMSVLDVDVPPSVAIHEANLGEMGHMIECLKMADILKPAKAAANELVDILDLQKGNLGEVALSMLNKCESKMVAVTDGEAGSIIAGRGIGVTHIDPLKVDSVVDTTGAGDAFLGGLIVGLTKYGYPCNESDMKRMGIIANAFGAACVQSVGGVPVSSSRKILEEYLSDEPALNFSSPVAAAHETSGLAGSDDEFTNSIMVDCQGLSSLVTAFGNEPDKRQSMDRFVSAIQECQGHVYTSGIGKSGCVAARLAGSLSSIGIPTHFVPATEWTHGDLGKLQSGKDVCIFFSHSGTTEETTMATLHVAKKGVQTMCITQQKDSALSTVCNELCLHYGTSDTLKEPFSCLPAATIVIQESLCNAIVHELIARLNITKNTFIKNHPGGAIGESQ